MSEHLNSWMNSDTQTENRMDTKTTNTGCATELKLKQLCFTTYVVTTMKSLDIVSSECDLAICS